MPDFIKTFVIKKKGKSAQTWAEDQTWVGLTCRSEKQMALGSVKKQRREAGRKKWMSPRSEMVGWRERSYCALSGGRRRVRWRRGGRTISAGTGARDRRRSAGYRSTLPFFLHNDAERLVSPTNPLPRRSASSAA